MAKETQSKESESDLVKPEATKSETVEVNVQDLRALIERVGQLEDQQKEILQTAPSDQIARIESLRRSGKLVKSVKLRSIDGQIALGWKIVKDDVYFEGSKLVEVQVIQVFFADGTSKEMNIRDFTRKASYDQYEVIREAKDNDGNITLTVITKDGREIMVGERFVN